MTDIKFNVSSNKISVEFNEKRYSAEFTQNFLFVGLPIMLVGLLLIISPTLRNVGLYIVAFAWIMATFVGTVTVLLLSGPVLMYRVSRYIYQKENLKPRSQKVSVWTFWILISILTAFIATKLTIPINPLFFVLNCVTNRVSPESSLLWRYEHLSYGWMAIAAIANYIALKVAED